MLVLISTSVHPSNLRLLPYILGVHVYTLCKCIGILYEDMFRIGEAMVAIGFWWKQTNWDFGWNMLLLDEEQL